VHQPELPLIFKEPNVDHYTIQLRRRPDPAQEEQVVREHTATDTTAAESLIEALRDSALQRDDVSWQAEEVNPEGNMFGLAPGGVVYVIQVTPPLSVNLSA
jgi:hypothetical protein